MIIERDWPIAVLQDALRKQGTISGRMMSMGRLVGKLGSPGAKCVPGCDEPGGPIMLGVNPSGATNGSAKVREKGAVSKGFSPKFSPASPLKTRRKVTYFLHYVG